MQVETGQTRFQFFRRVNGFKWKPALCHNCALRGHAVPQIVDKV